MKILVIYDGGCNFCKANLHWLRRLDWLHRFEGIAYQDKTLYTRYPQLRPEACEKAVHVVFPDGRTEQGGDAVREILLRLPLGFLPGLLLSIPPLRQIARRVYPVLARNRYHMRGHCDIRQPGDS